MKIGELLVKKGWLSREHLNNGLRLQKRTGDKLGAILLKIGCISEKQLVEALEEQLGFPSAAMFEATLDPGLVKYVSVQMARKHCMIPIRKIHDKLILAMEDPLNKSAVALVGEGTGMEVRPVLAAKSEIVKAIDHFYPRS